MSNKLNEKTKKALEAALPHLQKMGYKLDPKLVERIREPKVKLKPADRKKLEGVLSKHGRAVITARKGNIVVFTVEGYQNRQKGVSAANQKRNGGDNGEAKD